MFFAQRLSATEFVKIFERRLNLSKQNSFNGKFIFFYYIDCKQSYYAAKFFKKNFSFNVILVLNLDGSENIIGDSLAYELLKAEELEEDFNSSAEAFLGALVDILVEIPIK